ncbi:hypothetical protein INT43_000068 [Umbelopsis isabellina]|uniref:Uncharacterized protein n=1 Tax=Mortierella isabellina TaxID=91625 RepID=A0A8H7PF05_MORIS|nr:hypothetical protein INT43_000068 [Umbelopsis isabellina]
MQDWKTTITFSIHLSERLHIHESESYTDSPLISEVEQAVDIVRLPTLPAEAPLPTNIPETFELATGNSDQYLWLDAPGAGHRKSPPRQRLLNNAAYVKNLRAWQEQLPNGQQRLVNPLLDWTQVTANAPSIRELRGGWNPKVVIYRSSLIITPTLFLSVFEDFRFKRGRTGIHQIM